MSKILYESLYLKRDALINENDFFRAGSQAICLSRSEDGEHSMVIVKNSDSANNDGVFILNKREMTAFYKGDEKDYLSEILPNVKVICDRYTGVEKDGSLIEKTPYNIMFIKDDKLVSKWVVNVDNGENNITRDYYDQNFRNEFNFSLERANQETKNIFDKNGVKIRFKLEDEDMKDIFAVYISDLNYTIRGFDEHVAHKYIKINDLNNSILRRFDFRDEIVKENVPIDNLELGGLFKVLNNVELEGDKRLSKGDYYQVVKIWNDSYFFELLNIDPVFNNGDNDKPRALVFNCEGNDVSSVFRNVMPSEKKDLQELKVLSGFKLGQEITFAFEIVKKGLGGNAVNIKKGSTGVIIESDHKARVMIKDPQKGSLIKDFYRSEILTRTYVSNNIKEWMVLPKDTSVEFQNKWIDRPSLKSAKIFNEGQMIGEVLSNNSLYFFKEKGEENFYHLKEALVETLDKKDKEKFFKMKSKDQDLSILYHISSKKDQEEDFSFNVNQYISTIKNESVKRLH